MLYDQARKEKTRTLRISSEYGRDRATGELSPGVATRIVDLAVLATLSSTP